MANPLSKGWKYLMASFDQKIDENADPKVQIQQAVEAAKKQHEAISRHAAEIIGNKKQLEMKLQRLLTERQDYHAKAKTALAAADDAQARGDSAAAEKFTASAEAMATQLVSVESEIETVTASHAEAEKAAAQAQAQQQQSAARLQQQLAEVDKLLAQADQAEMQEKTTRAMDSLHQFGQGDDSVPTLDGVREKIERRYANAVGAQELAGQSTDDRMAEIAAASRDAAATAKLAEIRASMGSTGTPAVGGKGGAAGELESPSSAD